MGYNLPSFLASMVGVAPRWSRGLHATTLALVLLIHTSSPTATRLETMRRILGLTSSPSSSPSSSSSTTTAALIPPGLYAKGNSPNIETGIDYSSTRGLAFSNGLLATELPPFGPPAPTSSNEAGGAIGAESEDDSDSSSGSSGDQEWRKIAQLVAVVPGDAAAYTPDTRANATAHTRGANTSALSPEGAAALGWQGARPDSLPSLNISVSSSGGGSGSGSGTLRFNVSAISAAANAANASAAAAAAKDAAAASASSPGGGVNSASDNSISATNATNATNTTGGDDDQMGGDPAADSDPPDAPPPKKPVEAQALGKAIDGQTPLMPLGMLKAGASEGLSHDIVHIDYIRSAQPQGVMTKEWRENANGLLLKGMTSDLLLARVAGNSWDFIAKQFWPSEAIDRHFKGERTTPAFPAGGEVKEVSTGRYTKLAQENGSTVMLVNSEDPNAPVPNLPLATLFNVSTGATRYVSSGVVTSVVVLGLSRRCLLPHLFLYYVRPHLILLSSTAPRSVLVDCTSLSYL